MIFVIPLLLCLGLANANSNSACSGEPATCASYASGYSDASSYCSSKYPVAASTTTVTASGKTSVITAGTTTVTSTSTATTTVKGVPITSTTSVSIFITTVTDTNYQDVAFATGQGSAVAIKERANPTTTMTTSTTRSANRSAWSSCLSRASSSPAFVSSACACLQTAKTSTVTTTPAPTTIKTTVTVVTYTTTTSTVVDRPTTNVVGTSTSTVHVATTVTNTFHVGYTGLCSTPAPGPTYAPNMGDCLGGCTCFANNNFNYDQCVQPGTSANACDTVKKCQVDAQCGDTNYACVNAGCSDGGRCLSVVGCISTDGTING